MRGTLRERGEEIRNFILAHVEAHPADIARVTSKQFSISRQAANAHLRQLVDGDFILERGNTKARRYELIPLVEYWNWYPVQPGLDEHKVWRDDVLPLLEALSRNARSMWEYAFTEMFNNAIDHSGGTEITIYVERTPIRTEIRIYDDGVGIFKKIQTELRLDDERHAVLELAKGKLTTDPSRHSGEGIFFSSRVVDRFEILSGGVYFSHRFEDDEDWILERDKGSPGTAVWMQLNNHTSRTLKKVFDKFSSTDGDYAFAKTVVPVHLAKVGDDQLVSRSQGKRLMARVDRFRIVILDFKGVASIGQAFADEVFRVFAREHPEIEIAPINASEGVLRMISRAKAAQ